ncbi:polysaccharide deacetylase family protein [Streptomyces sp. NPDC093097]|uniref:polysaccharide deacetylase family protein n=1 Tax=Streptomyces sp. NPDC093097 TaxID=3366027 RepID=UPI0038102595
MSKDTNSAGNGNGRRVGTVRRAVVTAVALVLTATAAFTVMADKGAGQPAGAAGGKTTAAGGKTAGAGGKTAGASTAIDPALPAPIVDMAIVREAEDGGKAVNLTLDDGPDPRWTPKALELLKRFKAKAVFCLTGPNAAAHPDLVRRIVAEGHRLCNHSVSHDVAMDKKPVSYQEKEILDAKHMIDEASGGERIWYYRAPGGAFTPQSRQIAAAHGMRNLGWNVDPGDFRQPGADTIVRTVKEQLSMGPTVLLHDGGGNRAQTMEALERLLPWFAEEGYAFSFPKAG